MQVPEKDSKKFDSFLKQLGYPWVEETQNPAYQLFLK
jgi:threonine dehydratase